MPNTPQEGETPVEPFNFTTGQLYSLVRNYVTRTKYEELELLNTYGGVEALEPGLVTSFQHGLDVSEAAVKPASPKAEFKPMSPRASPPMDEAQELLQKRKGAFGVNVLPQRRPTPFWRLCLEAGSDFTLRILTLCGLISIVLGVTLGEHPEVEWIEGFAIWVAVFVVIAVTATNDWVKEKQFRKLGKVKDDRLCRVIRSGKERQTPVATLMVGDIVRLEVGDEVPADCLLISGVELRADESALTGESEAIAKEPPKECWASLGRLRASQPAFGEEGDSGQKCGTGEQRPLENCLVEGKETRPSSFSPAPSPSPSPTPSSSSVEKPRSGFLRRTTRSSSSSLLGNIRRQAGVEGLDATSVDHHAIPSPILLAGTAIVGGSGRAVVLGVGTHSQQGELYKQLTAFDAQPTPLQNKLNALARDIGRIGFLAACLTLFVLFLQYWILYGLLPKDERPSGGTIGREHVDFLVTAITILVVAVPEGLPLAVTISLAYSIGKMLADQNYVRRLAACETMGGANEICSDKTGTLTKNMMSVEAAWDGRNLTYREDELWRVWTRQGRELAHGGVLRAPTQPRAKVQSRKHTMPAQEAGRAERGEREEEEENEGCNAVARERGGGRTRFPPKYLKLLMDNIALNSTSVLEREARSTVEASVRSRLISMASSGALKKVDVTKQVGSPTECALLEFAGEMGFDYERIRDERILEDADLVHREPFTSDRKIMTTVVNAWDDFSDASPPASRLSSCHQSPASSSASASSPSASSASSSAPFLSSAAGVPSSRRRTLRVFVKGAAETVLKLCSHVVVPLPDGGEDAAGEDGDTPTSQRDREGDVAPLDAEKIMRIEREVIHKLAGEALRTICLAYKDISADEGDTSWAEDSEFRPFKKMEQGLTCLAIVGIRDPVRPEVPAAVLACQNAGIKVRMVTGDNIETAKQIAVKCNIYHPEKNGLALTGPEFNALVGGVVCSACRVATCDCPRHPAEERVTGKKMRVDVIANPDAFNEIADNLEVLARSQPMDKYALVVGLKELRGTVVAVTGDGANDAPALKKADVGFAMGLSGKEVAKQAADIVLLDDNFGSIVKAVKWGRNVYDNIRRFLQFQLTVNVVAVATAFLTATIIRESPLTAVQMLWVNLIMDSFASLALATEPPTDELLNRKPHSRHDYLISKVMFRNIVGQSVYQLIVMFSLIFGAEHFVPERPWTYLSPEARSQFPDFCEFSDCMRDEDGVPSGFHLRSGRRYHPFSDEEDYASRWRVDLGASRHYTLVFNVFVFMQIFNMINARKINAEWNVFSGIFRNKMWAFVVSFIFVVQVLVVEFGGLAVSCHRQGLTAVQWGISLAFGAGSVVVGFLLHLIPYTFLPETGKKEVDLLHEGPSLALASRGRLSSERLSVRLGGGLGMTSEQKRAIIERVAGNAGNSSGAADRSLKAVNSTLEMGAAKVAEIAEQKSCLFGKFIMLCYEK
ncbi:UNVERIFIED_CONTAM: calcium-translocating P-type ATPase, PMCA-type protein [Hammondia hammondi]|eukprot:XP_008882742.1 calcium-translocating P-type ATPase, PMCA-type protein [Hammondia hammondi]